MRELSLEDEIEILESEIDEHWETIKKMEEDDYDEGGSNWEREIDSLKSEIRVLSGQIADLKDRLNNLDEEGE